MATARVVTGLSVFPVKSCHRVEVDRAELGPYGPVGDREWQVVEPDGTFVTQRQHPELARVRPSFIAGGIRLTFDDLPDLEVERPSMVDRVAQTFSGPVRVADAGDEAAAWFEKVMGEPGRLTAIATGYERVIPGPVAAFGQSQASLSDLAPVLVANEASYRFLLDRSLEPFEIERFRPNVVVAGGEPWEEDTWRAFTVGEAAFVAGLPWPRCTIPQVDQETGERHREPAVVLKKHRWCSDVSGVNSVVSRMLCGNALFGLACGAGPEGAAIAVGDRVTTTAGAAPLLPPPPVPA